MQPIATKLEKDGCKLLKMVARDGIEPPTPAFSGLQPARAKSLQRLAIVRNLGSKKGV